MPVATELEHTATVHEPPVPGLDEVAALRWLSRPRQSSPWLNEEVASRLRERQSCIKGVPSHWISWQPAWAGLGAHAALVKSWPQSQVFERGGRTAASETDGSQRKRWNPLTWLVDLTQASASPPAEGVDMVWANMVLHLHARPKAQLREWQKALKVGGYLMFSGLGPGSLKELASVHARMGWPPALHPCTDMHDWGDMLVEVGFSEPVMDVDRITLTYSNAERMLVDLRDWGRNLHKERFGGLRGRAWRQAWLDAVERHGARDAEGRLLLSFELQFGHAMKAAPKLRVSPTLAVGLEDMRAQLKQGLQGRQPGPGSDR